MSMLAQLLKQDRFKPFALLTAAAGVAANLTGCSAAHVLSSISPKGKTTLMRDIAYGSQARQKLDIYQPRLPGPHPVVVFIYGGSWQSGDRAGYAFAGRSFARAGYTTVVIDYRLAPEYRYPDFVQDTANALSWTYRNIIRYGGNPNQLFVIGHSAGAFNGVTAVDDQRFWQTTQIPDGAIKGVIGLGGPYSYNFRNDSTAIAFPADGQPEAIMPDRHIRPGAPPHLIVTGAADQTVRAVNAERMTAALQQAGVPVTRVDIPKANHVDLVSSLATPLQHRFPIRSQILAFMQQQLKTQP